MMRKIISSSREIMVKLKCKRCKYEWEYKGKNLYWATCPHCLNKVKVLKQLKDDEERSSSRQNEKRSNH